MPPTVLAVAGGELLDHGTAASAVRQAHAAGRAFQRQIGVRGPHDLGGRDPFPPSPERIWTLASSRNFMTLR
jgi:hypothetical protein